MIIPIFSGKSQSLPTCLPFTQIVPLVGLINPHMHFISIVLPLPFLPISPCILPCSKETLTFFSISVFFIERSSSFISIIAIITLYSLSSIFRKSVLPIMIRQKISISSIIPAKYIMEYSIFIIGSFRYCVKCRLIIV